jgi:hypothetical protein
MKRGARVALTLLGVILLAAPVGVVLTILLQPLWSWLEARTGLESLGHSGPAGWCYVAVWMLVASFAGYVVLSRSRKP